MISLHNPPMAGWRGLAGSLFEYGGQNLAKTLALVACAAVLEGFGLVLLLPIVELIVSETPSTGLSSSISAFLAQAGIISWWQRMAVLFGGFFLIMLLRAAVLLRRDVAIMQISQGFVDHIRHQLLHALVYSSWSQIQSLRKSDMLDSLTTNIARIGMAMRFATQSSISIAMVAVFTITAFLISVPAGLLLLATIALAAMMGIIWLARSNMLGKGMTVSGQNIAQETMRFLDGLKAAKTTQAEEQFLERFAQAVARSRVYAVDFSRQQGRMRRAIELLGAIMAMVLVALGYGVFAVSTVELLLIGGILIRLIPALNAGMGGLQGVANALPAFDMAQQLRAEAARATELPKYGGGHNAKIMTPGPLVINNLAFGYQPDDIVLTCDNITLPGTGLILVSGSSGSGKTSFADILAGLVTAEKGDISYGHIRLEPAHRTMWQQHISYAVQDGFLFDANVRENVLWPDRQDDDAAVWDVLEQACIADVVRALPNGLDENMRNAGSRLSGGERQRIALARAFLRPSNILILDESLSALDAQTAEQLIGNLQLRAKRQLVILVSHIAAHAHKADAHIVIADGHAALVKPGK